MEIHLEQLLGLWRFMDDNLIIDFNLRQFDERIQRGLSFFTVYAVAGENNGINYEWQGIPSIVNTPQELPIIEIVNLNASEVGSIYQDITIWSFEANVMTLQFGDGTRLEFQKLR